MAKYKALQSFPMAHPQNPKRQILVRGGDEVELDDEFVDGGIENGVLQSLDEQPEEAEAEEAEPVLPDRPSNGATKDTWRAYLAQLGGVTAELGPLEVPDNATRDEMIAIGDKRVADWNEV